MAQFVIACGGTGGHLTPGIALAQELQSQGHRTLLLTSQKVVDSRLRSHYEHSLEFRSFPGCGFSLRPGKFLRFCGALMQSYWQSLKLLRHCETDGVIAFGGFGSLGIGLAAKTLEIPLFLHESNQVMGKAIKMLSPFAKRVYIPKELKSQFTFCSRARYKAMGYPLRQDFNPVSAEKARKELNLPPNDRLLIISGGSQGARPLVEWVRRHEKEFSRHRTHVHCLTGLDGSEEDHWISSSNGGKYLVRYQRFCDRMHLLYSAADLAISRAGAGTIAELCHCHLPAILVPYPHAAHDHQTQNALVMARRNMALLISESSLEQNATIWSLIDDENRRQRLRETLIAKNSTKNSDASEMAKVILGQLFRENIHG